MSDEILAAITPSAWRRFLAVGMLAGVGVLLIYLGFTAQEAIGPVKLIAVTSGGAILALADWVRRATDASIVLTAAGLHDTHGRALCSLDDIASLDRSAFAFKPSNGLGIRLKSAGSVAWAPGLWWRFGKRIGIGGVTAASESKFMADMITLYQAGHIESPPKAALD